MDLVNICPDLLFPAFLDVLAFFLLFKANKEGKSAINLSNLRKFCQIWPRAIYYC